MSSENLTTNKCLNELGEPIQDIKEGKNGIYLASSRYGITIFDLFSEILQDYDMRQFLRKHSPNSQEKRS